jgi:light-regulated signal transduction histidine kinase (bacteriophytochrome)
VRPNILHPDKDDSRPDERAPPADEPAQAADAFALLEQRVAELTMELERRSRELDVLNRELESFSYSVAHDLRAPLLTIDGFSQILQESSNEALDAAGRQHLERITTAVAHMQRMIEDLLGLAKIIRVPMLTTSVDLSALGQEIMRGLRAGAPDRKGEFIIAPGLTATGDPALLRVALQNLLANAWKFTSRRESARIELESDCDAAGDTVYVVRDNGVGFDPRHAGKLFAPFQRCHAQSDFPGTGIGLATVQRIIRRHGGRIWADAQLNRGASFCFTIPQEPKRS